MKRHWHAGVGVLPLAVSGACLGRRAGPHPDAKRRWDLCPCHHLGCHREDRCMATLVRHGTYRWTTSSPSWMKAATRVTPRGSRPCPGIIGERYDGRAAMIGQQFSTCPKLRAALDVLPGWGPVIIRLFRRELRGVWPGAQPPRGPRAEHAADTSASSAPARLPQRFSASPSWRPDVTPAAGASKAAWSGLPWRITAGDGPMPGRAPVCPVHLVLCQPATDRV